MELSSVFRPLLSVAQLVFKKLRPLRAEKAAGSAPENVQPVDDSILEAAILRLAGGRLDDSLGQRFAKLVPHLFITPEHLKTPNVVHWLNEPSVRIDLRDAARMKSLGSAVPEEVSARLQARYSEVALAGPQESGSVVSTAIAILATSVSARGRSWNS